MIRALLTAQDGLSKPTVLLGLDSENFRRLADGNPISVNLQHLDPDGPPTFLPDILIVIFDQDTTEGQTPEAIQLLETAAREAGLYKQGEKHNE